ncbi:uncharacterized protein GIQ15_01848 [Arthroderma uncinatum]|uniref:uncharacterized protein n=1 Tax=Arthroderma uncinatum TaxID=74035 RepID=UPI00144ABBB3|nr:uncharacterized protein GIQ15_01848 [Arthroderma uncinatum]KAF3492331.1 hypothetical protein GIQ15_01848 [Arthroderma uncinatum]
MELVFGRAAVLANSQLVKYRYKAIPLGKRTFFTVTDTEMCLGKKSRSIISTLDIETSQSGKVVVSLQPEFHAGLSQLSVNSAVDNTDELRLHDDIWLAPTGLIARYIGIGGNEYALESGNSYITNNSTYGAKNGLPDEGHNAWKLAICSWIERLGIPIELSDGMRWIQVEVAASPQHLGLTKATSIRRIYWPAELCFKRAHLAMSSPVQGSEALCRDSLGPLHYAHQWLSGSVPRDEVLRRNIMPDEARNTELDLQIGLSASPSGVDISNTAESMARALAYPDFQPATVYPTPPGGALAFWHPPPENIGVGGEYPLDLSRVSRQESEPNAADLLLEATSPGFGAGVAMYDTAGDDDLFEEMGDNFDDKGITEADFSFFDEPGLSDSNLDIDSGNTIHDIIMEEHSAKEPKADLEMSEQLGSVEPVEVTEHHEIETPKNDDALKGGPDKACAETTTSPSREVKTDSEKIAERPMSPPLSPARIKQILFPGKLEGAERLASGGPSIHKGPTEEETQLMQHRSRYDPVPFQRGLDFSDKKYGVDGRFWFFPDTKNVDEATASHKTKIPVIGELVPSSGQVGGISYPYNENCRNGSPDSERGSTSNSSRSSIYGDNHLQAEFNKRHHLDPTDNKLRRPDLDDLFSVNSSLPSPGFNVGKRYTMHSDPEEGVLLSGLIHPTADWSFAGHFKALKSSFSSVLCGRDDIIHVAQLLVDQVTQSSLEHKTELTSEKDDERDIWHSLIDDIDTMGQSRRSGLKCYASIGEGSSNQQRKDTTSGSIINLRSPHMHIRRGNCSLEVLPTAIHFWETFGLEPLKGKKDIISYCLHPISMQEDANAFLDRLGLTYSSANLGSCSRPGSTKGLVPWSLSKDKLDYPSIMRKLQHVCENLGTALSNLTMSNKSIVVYIVNPFKIGAATVDICVAFLRLFHKYIEEADKRTPRHLNELVLQIIPSDFIAVGGSLVIPTQTDYLRLALEVYSRCPPREPVSDMFGCAPAFTLAAPIPKMIPFKLTADEGSPMDAGQPYHLAYSMSYDQRWVTAAWTDNLGQRQLTLSYSLRDNNSRTFRSMSEVREDIWQTTADMTGLSRGRWRVIIVKDEPMDAEEVAAWASLAAQHNQHHPSQIELILLTINTRPSLRLKIPPPPPQLNTLYQSGNASTPVSTPKPNISSPDPSTNAPTPPQISTFTAHTPSSSSEPSQPQSLSQSQQTQIPVDTNAETVLIDKSDEAWALVLSHRLNNSQSFTTYKPALANGYLILEFPITSF